MSTQPQPAPVLAWHREAANEVRETIDRLGRCYVTDEGLSAIIAAHDPHAETVRLLEEAYQHVYNAAFEERRTIALVDSDKKSPISELANEIRDHLAKLKGTQ